MLEKENQFLEYKQEVNRTYLKTVSAFANFNDGKIIFGITDDLKVIGVENPNVKKLDIENQINDSIKPKPEFTLKINEDNTITLNVKKGLQTPYRYNGKSYGRNDSSTIELDSFLENRLVLKGMNLNFEELPSKDQNLTFTFLEEKLNEKLNISSLNNDILKTLNLCDSKSTFNNAASLIADKNNFPGIDIVVFGDSIDIFKKRFTLSGESILKQYFDSLEIFKNEYFVEKIEGGFRQKYEIIPFNAYREAVANSIIHRDWDIKANTKIEMHPDKIRISSPGGLMSEISKENFLNGSYSVLKNPIIANIFHRLEIVEIFATGIRRINDSYKEFIKKPTFEVTSNSITIILPNKEKLILNQNESKLFSIMDTNYEYTRNDLEKISNLSKDLTIRTLNSLINKNLVKKVGSGRNIIYIKNNY